MIKTKHYGLWQNVLVVSKNAVSIISIKYLTFSLIVLEEIFNIVSTKDILLSSYFRKVYESRCRYTVHSVQ